MQIKPSILALGAGLALSGAIALPANAGPIGPTPYLSFADSPFSGGGFSYFHLETFEDHLLNSPGVTASAGGVTSVVFGPNIHDSVDADDGAIDGSGLSGDSFFSGFGATGFSFNAGVLGSLPDSVGIVWTDGAGTATFQAFDADGNLLGSLGCAVKRRCLPAGANPARQLSLRPVAIGAVVEVTKRLKPSV